jgi:hypothetical protein
MDEDLKKDEENSCVSCEEEHGCAGCGGKRERADTWWYVIALLVILLLAILFRGSGGT